MKPGDRIRFKKPKRKPLYGTVDHIESDIAKMYWAEGATVPRYIRVRVDVPDKQTGEIKPTFVWTTESKIIFVQGVNSA